MSAQIEELIARIDDLHARAAAGPWGIWREKTPDKLSAILELAEMVKVTEPFAGELFLLDAGGKCPATTGCGPRSEANAELITALVNAWPLISASLKARIATQEGGQ